MEFLSCRVRSSFPEQGVTCHNSYTLQRCVTFPMRDQSLAAQPGVPSRLHFLGVGPSRWSKPITALLRDPVCPPFCTPRPRGSRIMVTVHPELPPRDHAIHHRQQVPRGIKGSHPLHVPNIGTRLTASCPLTYERKKIQLTSPEPYRSHG